MVRTQTLVCRQSVAKNDVSHHIKDVAAGLYEKKEHRWRDTRSLTCDICDGKMVPREEAEYDG